jgi:hypothetical protein
MPAWSAEGESTWILTGFPSPFGTNGVNETWAAASVVVATSVPLIGLSQLMGGLPPASVAAVVDVVDGPGPSLPGATRPSQTATPAAINAMNNITTTTHRALKLLCPFVSCICP